MSIFKYKYDDLYNPLLKSLHQLGGSGTNSEIEEKIAEILELSDEEVEDIHRGNRTKLTYRTAWAKNYLKRFGLIENSSRAVWALTSKGRSIETVKKTTVNRFVKNLDDSKTIIEKSVSKETNNSVEELGWEEELVSVLKSIEPDAFERLSQRLLRELGFANVEVTGKSGDGGIDGVGVIKMGGVLSFHVVFQCKRYSKPVSSSAIRDFRGAMIGRADKGLFITTSSFTRGAKAEAHRDGAPPIDLVDGSEFAQKLKELNLGVSIAVVEKVKINKSWFADI